MIRQLPTKLLAVLGPFVVLHAAAQEGLKQIEVNRQLPNAAVVITKVLYRDTPLQCGLVVSAGLDVPPVVQPVTPFEAGDDWLQHVTVFLYNRTDKTIVFTSMTVRFLPETGDGTHVPPMAVAPISLGRVPDGFAFSARTHKPVLADPRIPPISFAPHQTLLVDLGSYIEVFKGSAIGASVPFNRLTKGLLDVVVAYFEDRMKWGGGGYWIEDADHPGKFKILDQNYFPAAKMPRWPAPVDK